ncbi:DNA/RNA-binding protein Alba-like protein [Tanacetum coccineum]
MGRAINMTVTIVKLIKVCIFVKVNFGTDKETHRWSSSNYIEGLLSRETTRHVSMITITLSKNELNTTSIGYQPPLPADQVKPLTEFEYEGAAIGKGHARRGRGRGRARASQGNNYAPVAYEDGDWDGPRGFPMGRGRGRGRNFCGHGRGNYSNAPINKMSEVTIKIPMQGG